MILTVVGSSSGLAVRDRAFSCLHLEVEKNALLIDAGEGTTHQLLWLGLDPIALREVWLTHCHADHAGGLMGLLTFLHLSGRTAPFTVYLPPASQRAMEQALEAFHIRKERWRFPFALVPITNPLPPREGWRIQAIENKHLGAGASMSIMVEKGDRRILITSDIDQLDPLIPFARNAEILIAECTHVSIAETLAFAASHGIRRVYFTHIPPDLDVSHPPEGVQAGIKASFVRDGDRIVF